MKRALAAFTVALALVAVSASAAPAKKPKVGTLQTSAAYSAALGANIDYTVYLPYGYDGSGARYPVLYLLHGRGDTMTAWTQVKSDLDRLIEVGEVPPVIAVMPDAPWSSRGSYYVDSSYTGTDDPGRPVETALTRDLISHVDSTYRSAAHRGARMVGGYSMGGAGALRFALAHQDLFAHALVLSPAVYTPQPPSDSSAREFGGYGNGTAKFDEAVYERLSYPALLSGLDRDRSVRMFIAVGDDEWMAPEPQHDLDFEAAKLYNTIRRSNAVAAQFRVLDGGHEWTVWRQGFIDGLKHLGRTLSATPPAGLPEPLLGGATADRAGGVAGHADGTVTVGMAVTGTGTGLDAVVTRLAADRKTPLWSKQFSTSANDRLYGVIGLADGGVIAAGYTRGDLDGTHAGSPADDMFAVRLSATGETLWLRQFGDPGKADRVYGLAAAPDGGAYLMGYTSGSQDGPSAGDKDAVLVRIDASGQTLWTRQLGGTGEDKAFAGEADATGVYVAGSAGQGMPGAPAIGGLDGWIARFASDGTRQWVKVDGSSGSDLLAGLAIDSAGRAVATGSSAGDVLAVAYTATGTTSWRSVIASGGTDVGADVVALPGGDVAVVGFSDGIWGVPAGGRDVLVVRLDRRGNQVSSAQFGSPRDDAGDAFGEENVYATLAGDRILVSGITNDDVFLASVDPATGLP